MKPINETLSTTLFFTSEWSDSGGQRGIAVHHEPEKKTDRENKKSASHYLRIGSDGKK